jgi:tetratricopeptide (TPR) repeat protein
MPAAAQIPDPLGVTPEQRQAAAAQYERAREVVRTNRDITYALQLLLSCCKLDPAVVRYRKVLREVGRATAEQKRAASWLGGLSLGNFGNRGKFKAARKAEDHRKALEHGEELLARDPRDIGVQLEMAESAEALGLMEVAVWMLEYARAHDPRKITVNRPLAQLYEKQKRWNNAIALWEELRQANPRDHEAAHKINELSVNDTLARGNFRG